MPKVDGERLFNEMMFSSRDVDPWMFPALEKLRANGQYIVAALSNTVIFPESHALHAANSEFDPLRRMFDCYISSAHVGLRKPDPRIYQHAVRELDEFARDNANSLRARGLKWKEGIQPNDVLFLDDIGENLKWAKKEGFQTIKVPLGKAYEAVDQLEAVTGLQLAGNHPRIPDQPKAREAKARI
jgi:FMN phosphatase YigB (HAD superfamily)